MADRDFDRKDGKFATIMNEWFDARIKYGLTEVEERIVSLIIRKTWCIEGRSWAPIRWTDFIKRCEISKGSASRALNRLINERNFIHVKTIKGKKNYHINAKPSTWKKPKSYPKTDKKVPELELIEGGIKVPELEPKEFQNWNKRVPELEPPPYKETVKDTRKDTPSDSPKKKPKKPASRKKPKQDPKEERACGLPAGFNLSLENEKYAVMKGIDIKKVDDFFDSFTNWASAKGIECVDWEAQFKTHVDNAPRFGRQYMLKPKKRR